MIQKGERVTEIVHTTAKISMLFVSHSFMIKYGSINKYFTWKRKRMTLTINQGYDRGAKLIMLLVY